MKTAIGVFTISLFVCVSTSYGVLGNAAYNNGFSVFQKHSYVNANGSARVHVGYYHPRSHSAASPVGAAYRNIYRGGISPSVQHLRNYNRSIQRLGNTRIHSGGSSGFGNARIYSKTEIKQIKKQRYEKRKAERIKKNYVVPSFLE